jgi:RNA polymerase sigma-70 factor (ECF subfamily)
MLGCFPDAEDAVQDTMLRAWKYRDSLKEGSPLRPWLYRVATNACLDAIARDQRRATVAAKAAESADGCAGSPEDVVWLGPIPDSVLIEDGTPETLALSRETIEIAFLTVIQLLTPQQRAALILCDIHDWSSQEAADLLEISVAAVNSALQRARARLKRDRLMTNLKTTGSGKLDANEAERELVKKYVEAGEAQDYRLFASLIREDAIFRMPPDPALATGREEIFKVWTEGGFGSEEFGSLRCVVTGANLQPAIAAYVRQPGDSDWRALTLETLRIEGGLVTEIVVFLPETFRFFGLPMVFDPAPIVQTVDS